MNQKTNPYRIEQDSLGAVQVPVNALYGAQTQRAIENFSISGMHPYPSFTRALVQVKKSAANVNYQLGYLAPEIKEVICQAADEVLSGLHANQFVVDPFQAGAGTSHNMNVNEVLANRATQLLGGAAGDYRVHPNDHVNMAQSTNDTIPTAIRIGCLVEMEKLLPALDELIDAFAQKADAFDDFFKSGRTHLQDAVPIRLGQEFKAYQRTIERDRERILQAATGLRRLGIGGTAVGTGLNADPRYHALMVANLSKTLGIELYECDDLIEAMQSMADLVSFSGALRTLAVSLTRIANDIRLLSSGPGTGLAEITLQALQPGSSIMPGKVNPVMAEMLNMAMYHLMGCDTTVCLASQAGQLELNVMMPIIGHNLFEMLQVAIGAIHAFSQKCVLGISANPEMMNFWLERNPIIVTALNPLIGYQAGTKLVNLAQERNQPVRQIAEEEASAGRLIHIQTGKPVTLEDISGALDDLRRLTEGGISG